MLAMMLYVFALFYSPGPVTVLSFNQGLRKHSSLPWLFCIGTGCAMSLVLLITCYSGKLLENDTWLPVLRIAGGLYILYLAGKMIFDRRTANNAEKPATRLYWLNGFAIHMINPKAWVGALPLATVYYPTLGITGLSLLTYSLALGLLAAISPVLYFLVARYCSRFINNDTKLRRINTGMGLLLAYSAMSMLR